MTFFNLSHNNTNNEGHCEVSSLANKKNENTNQKVVLLWPKVLHDCPEAVVLVFFGVFNLVHN